MIKDYYCPLHLLVIVKTSFAPFIISYCLSQCAIPLLHPFNMNWILQRIKYTRETFLGPKTKIYKDHITIVGFNHSYKGRKPTRDIIGKIMCWGPCKNTTDIRAFLGTAVQCCNHILNFVIVASSLYEVIKKDVIFKWSPIWEKAQSDLKMLIELCFYTRNPKFPSEQPLVLAVNTVRGCSRVA